MRLDLRDHIVDPLHHRLETVARVDLLQPVGIRLPHLLRDLCALDQRLAGYTTVVETIAAHFGGFYQSHLDLDGGGDIGGDQTRSTCADHHQIAIIFLWSVPALVDLAALDPVDDPFSDPRGQA